MNIGKAEEVIGHMGTVFGAERIAQEAIADIPFYITSGDDPVVVGWDIFLELLDAYGELEAALTKGFTNKRILYILAKQVRFQDAEDVYQMAISSAWKSFYSFRPKSASSWDQWLLMIAKRKLNNFLEALYNERDRIHWQNQDYFDVLYVEEEEEEEDWRHKKVRAVAERWISGGHPRKALFAARVLATLNGEDDYIGLSGSYMAEYTGAARQTLSRWTKDFIMEVHNES